VLLPWLPADQKEKRDLGATAQDTAQTLLLSTGQRMRSLPINISQLV